MSGQCLQYFFVLVKYSIKGFHVLTGLSGIVFMADLTNQLANTGILKVTG